MARPRRPEVLACVTAARHRGLAILHVPTDRHLWVPRHAGGAIPAGVRFHRATPIAPAAGGVESVADMLEHVTRCLPELEALVVWESALHHELVGIRELRRIRWRSPHARHLASIASNQSDSILETIMLHRLRELGIPVAQQVHLLGHKVDFLVGRRLVIQTDGFAFHGGRQRQADIEYDARLALEGYVVLRFSYADVIERWEQVRELIIRHLATGSAAID